MCTLEAKMHVSLKLKTRVYLVFADDICFYSSQGGSWITPQIFDGIDPAGGRQRTSNISSCIESLGLPVAE